VCSSDLLILEGPEKYFPQNESGNL
jgi:hypothetical protein